MPALMKDTYMFNFHQLTTRFFYIALLIFLVLQAGCGRGGPDVQFVTGVVTLDGKPLEGAIVSFSPQDNEGLPAVGTTQTDGRFHLNAPASLPGSGTTQGEYKVLIEKTEYVEFPEIPDDDPRYGTPEHDRLIQLAEETPPVFKTPKFYADADLTPFSVEVKRGQNNFTFELHSGDNP